MKQKIEDTEENRIEFADQIIEEQNHLDGKWLIIEAEHPVITILKLKKELKEKKIIE